MSEPTEGKLVQDTKGRFVKGVSGNPGGRPVGSKNKITLQKLLAEEAFRSRNEESIRAVLDLVVSQALDGDKGSQKLIWDATVSKAQVAEDKSAGTKQEITVHHMKVANPKEEEK